MVNFRDEIIDPGRESRVAGARQDLHEVILRRLRGVGGAVSWHYDGPVDCELLGREDVMEELEDCFCVMTSA